jgi:multimeric flavodoxin WrbA
MKITGINGSPKGKYSITYQSVRYLEKRVPDVSFSVFHIGAEIKKLEAREELMKQYESIINDISL